MAIRNSDYWRERFSKLEELQHKKVIKFDKELEKAYTRTLSKLEKDLNYWYNRYAENNLLTLEDARKRLNNRELREFRLTVEEYVRLGQLRSADPAIMKLLENASARVHISRLESLFVQYTNHVDELFAIELQGFNELLATSYLEQYNRVAFIVQTGTGIAYPLASINDEAIRTIIAQPWASDGSNFSARIYRDREQLTKVLQTELIQALQLGEGVAETANRVRERMGVSFRNAVRLVQTEEAAILSRANKDSLKNLNVEQYEFIATLDSKTSNICQTFDRRVFPLKEYEVGVTSPPLHVNCRSTTAPYFEDIETYGERIARDNEGRTIYVPGNMSYKEWKEKYGV